MLPEIPAFVSPPLRREGALRCLLDVGEGPPQTPGMLLRSAVGLVAGLSVVAFASGAFACGGDKDQDDQKEPSVLCDGDHGDEDKEKEPSVLCDGDHGDEDKEKEPSVLCDGDHGDEDKEKEPSLL